MADPFFKDLAFAALAQTARNPTRDFLQATPRNPILGYLSDLAASSYSPERTQQMQGVAKFMSAPAISETLDRLSYGEPLTTGAGGLGGTTRVRPEALEAAMAVAPTVGPAGRAAGATAMAAGRAGERLAERSIPQIMQRGGMGSEMLQGMSRGTVSPLDVYHGTPHTFPPTARNPLGEFDASKIGSGEGAQAYGHGLYLAEDRGIADVYRKKLTGADGAPVSSPNDSLQMKIGRLQFEVDKLRKSGDSSAPAMIRAYEGRIKELNDAGSLYKVDLPDDQIAKMLDWDKPMTESEMTLLYDKMQQSPLASFAKPFQDNFYSAMERGHKTPDGQDLFMELSKQLGGQKYVSEALRELGIPGIKYLDATSRGTGKGTRNFVTFPGEEKNLTILERNNQPVQQAMQEFEQSLINFMATPAK